MNRNDSIRRVDSKEPDMNGIHFLSSRHTMSTSWGSSHESFFASVTVDTGRWLFGLLSRLDNHPSLFWLIAAGTSGNGWSRFEPAPVASLCAAAEMSHLDMLRVHDYASRSHPSPASSILCAARNLLSGHLASVIGQFLCMSHVDMSAHHTLSDLEVIA